MKTIHTERKNNLILMKTSQYFIEYSKKIVLSLSLIIIGLVSLSFGQFCPKENPNCDNGIGVSNPKVFDNRSLIIMLEELNRQLQSIKVIDQKSLLDSLGLTQGYQSSDVSRSFEFGTVPIPGVKTTLKPDDDGNLNITEEVTDRKEASAKSPALPDLIAAPKYEPKFGISSEDLLSQQIDLTYKIFNLRMLLERSISDRLTSADANQGSRLQTVLGFNVSLDPPKDSRDMAAFVELKIETTDGKPVSVVSLMPQEKTYNTSALSTKSNAFGGSAVFKVFTVGYSERRRGQTFYLYQDADTITYQRMPEVAAMTDITNQPPVFGWEFRPVLGRRSVSPGMRQIFAVLSVDKRDLVDNPENTNLKVTIQTYWRKYSRKTLSVYDEKQESRSFVYSAASVFPTTKYQRGLSPKISNIRWNQLDDKNGVLLVEGENFFTGTSVIVGGNTLDSPSNGLNIKSDQTLLIRTTLDSISSGDVVINGRYGANIALADLNQLSVKGIEMYELIQSPINDKTTRIKIQIQNKNIETDPTKGNLTKEDIQKFGFSPVIKINSKIVPLVYPPQDVDCNFTNGKDKITKKCVLVIADVPSSLVSEDSVISVRVPLLGPNWEVSRQLSFPTQPSNVKLAKLTEDNGKSLFSITGKELNQFEIKYSPVVPIINNSRLITFELTDAQIKQIKNIILINRITDEPTVLEIPDALPKPASAKITEADPPQVFVKSSKTIKFKGEGLAAIKQVLFEGQDLQIIKKSEKEIIVLLTREVTKEAGEVEIIFKSDKDVTTGKVLVLEQSKETKP